MNSVEQNLNLLMVDISSRLPYKVIVECPVVSYVTSIPSRIDYCVLTSVDALRQTYSIGTKYTRRANLPIISRGKIVIKPLLRPMSSMTKDERLIYENLCNCIDERLIKAFDYLNSIHVDYRGFIELGLAIDVTKLNKNPYDDEFIY